MFDSPEPFTQFGLSHLIVLLFTAFIIFGVYFSRKWHLKHQQIITNGITALAVSFFPLHFLIYYFYIKTFDIRYDLPILQVCGLITISIVAYLNIKSDSNKQFWYNIIFFWGISAMLASFFTPALKEDFPHIYFWLFWGSHWDIVYILSFVLLILPSKIKYIDVWWATLTLAIYASIMYPFNLLINANYGFVISKPESIHFGYLLGINFDQSPAYLLPATIVIVSMFHLLYFGNKVLERFYNSKKTTPAPLRKASP